MATTKNISQNMPKILKEVVGRAVKDCYDSELSDFTVAIPNDSRWGDYACNAALKLAPTLKQSPVEIARNLTYRLQGLSEEPFEGFKNTSIEVAESGFINFKLSRLWLQNILKDLSSVAVNYRVEDFGLNYDLLSGKKIMVEYTDPNPFKLFHIGHLVPNAVGESFARLFEYCGAEVKRASYQGDAGMHVSQSIWGMMEKFKDPKVSLEEIESLDLKERVSFLGECYALGSSGFSEDSEVEEAIKNINYLVYISAQENLEEARGWELQVDYKKYLTGSELDYEKVKKLYNLGRQWSLDYFETIYELLGTKFDYYYFESMTGEYGMKIVNEYVRQGIFSTDKGAIIFEGEKHGLHTRVFVNSQGLPTYEAKDLGLVYMKIADFDFDLSYVITAAEQESYFAVVYKALEQIDRDLAFKSIHVSNGMMTLADGKMSSRTGNIIAVDELIDQLAQAACEKMAQNISGVSEEERRPTATKIAVSALKYAILKQQLGKNIVYNKERSLQLTGNTGPYLQYTFVRIYSILEKADFTWGSFDLEDMGLSQEEELLLRKLTHFNEEVCKSTKELLPSYLCTYLYELAGLFNTLYSKVPILDTNDDNLRNFRLGLINGVGVVLKQGLYLLGIETVDRM